MAEALERQLADHGDRRRVKEVGDVGARNRAADEDSPLAVDEEARGAWRVAVGDGAAEVAGGLGVVGVEVEPRTRGGLGRVTDGGDLRVGEDHVRSERAVGAVGDRMLIAEDVVGGEPGLVLAHVRVGRGR